MSFKRDPETGAIKAMKVENAIFSYSFLVQPRPEGGFHPGQYGTELILHDEKVIAEVKEYVKQAIQEGKSKMWDGKVPKGLHLPIKEGDDEKELEAGGIILKTSSKTQPEIYIRSKKSGKAYMIDNDDDTDEIYSGMIGEAMITLRTYDVNGMRGIKAYVNAVCKTGEGTPLGSTVSYVDEFSLASKFDEDDEDEYDGEEPEEEEEVKPPKKTKSSTKKSTKKPTKAKVSRDDADDDDEEESEDLDLDTLVKTKGSTKKDSSNEKTTLDDLLKRN